MTKIEEPQILHSLCLLEETVEYMRILVDMPEDWVFSYEFD